MASIYRSVPTRYGQARLADALQSGTPVGLFEMALGDGNGAIVSPNEDMKDLVREVYRGEINEIERIDATTVRVALRVPSEVGGFTVREVGLYDDSGEMVAVGNYAATYKPLPEDGSVRELYVRMWLKVSSVDQVAITVDTSIIYATKEWTSAYVIGRAATDAEVDGGVEDTKFLTPRGFDRVRKLISGAIQAVSDALTAHRQSGDHDERYARRTNNLSDLSSPSQARSNLGLGASATMGTTASRTSSSADVVLQAKAMNDHRQSGDHDERYARRANNLSDLSSPSQARSNLGLGASATMGTTASRASSSADVVLQAKAMNDHRQSGDHDDRYVQSSGDSMSGDLTISKGNPWLTLNSITTGEIGTDQGAGVSIGESGYKGGAAMHLTYTGDGKGHIGMGTVDPTTGIPEYNAMELHYRGYDVTFKGALQLPGATTLEGGTTGLRISNASNGSVDIGNRNTGYTHYQSTTGKHYFYGDVHAQGRFAGDGSGLTGTASLRATGTTKDDVGLSRIPNVEVTANPDPSTIMQRNTSGDVWARLFRSTYTPKNSNVQVIYTSASDDGTDFMRPSTPAQVMDAIGATRRISTGSGLTGGGDLSGDRTLSVDSSILRASGDRAAHLRLNSYTYLNDYDEPFGSDHGLRFYVRDAVINMSATGGETGHPELNLGGDRVYHQGNLDSAFASNLGPSGSARLPGGLIIQWGQTGLMGIDSNAAVNFNVTFPNRCLQVVASTLNSFTGDDDVFARVIEHTRSQVTLRTEAVNEDYSGSRRIMFIAIGH